MKTRIYEISRDAAFVYGAKIIVCTNRETVVDCLGDDRTGNGNAWYAEKITDAVCRAIDAAFGFGNYDCDSEFRNWHGGKYSHQAAMCGYETHSWGVTKFYRAETDEENGDGDFGECKLADLPEALQAKINAGLAAISDAESAAIAESEKEIAEDEAELQAQLAAEKAEAGE